MVKIKGKGQQIYNLLKEKGEPWGVGTIAITSGLSARLIYKSMEKNEDKEEVARKIAVFFELCDRDSFIFKNQSDHKDELNSTPIELLHLIICQLEEVIKQKEDVKEELSVDFTIGIKYLIQSGYQIIRIIEANKNQGISERELKRHMKKLAEIERQIENKGEGR